MDCSAIVLNKLLTEKSLDTWARIKLVFLDPAFASLYSAISKYYDTYSTVPSFDELELTLREGVAMRTLATVKLVDASEISTEVAINALIDQYTQNETIRELDKYIDKLPMYSSEEIKENLSSIVLRLDEKTLTTEGVYNMADIMLFKSAADLARDRVHLGLNNKFDAVLAGVARQELILLGGRRGSGKSITCSNVQINEYEAGYVCPYFTIEMIAHETLERNMSILANVSHQRLKQGRLEPDEMLRVIKARADMFVDANDLVQQFTKDRDQFKFESNLVRFKALKPDNQMIIIDDRALSITNIDLHMGKLKAKFGDKFRTCVVDYLNQVIIDGMQSKDQYDWKYQTTVAKKLKELARKHDVVMFSPFQTDESGEARMARGILDAADIALVTKVHDKEKAIITFDTTKIRGGAEMKFTSGINWESLRISPQDVETPSESEGSDERKIKNAAKKKSKKEEITQPDGKADIPWDA